MGYAFTYPVVHYLTHVKIATYTHYPTIRCVIIEKLLLYMKTLSLMIIMPFNSSDMLQRVYERRRQYNNDSKLAASTIWTSGKLM